MGGRGLPDLIVANRGWRYNEGMEKRPQTFLPPNLNDDEVSPEHRRTLVWLAFLAVAMALLSWWIRR
jgi:hypothetical protein